MWDHLQKSTYEGAWAETVNIVACALLFQRRIFTYSMSKGRWYRFEPISRAFPTTEPVGISANKPCKCPIKLAYYGCHPQCFHFNLLVPSSGNCCDVPEPYNFPSQPSKTYATVVKLTQPAKSMKSNATNTAKCSTRSVNFVSAST